MGVLLGQPLDRCISEAPASQGVRGNEGSELQTHWVGWAGDDQCSGTLWDCDSEFALFSLITVSSKYE